MSEPKAKKETHVTFDGAALKDVEELKEVSGRAKVADVVRDALSLYRWAYKQIRAGHQVGALRTSGFVAVELPFENTRKKPTEKPS